MVPESLLSGGKQDSQSGMGGENAASGAEPVLKKATTLASLSPAMDIFSMG